MAPTTAAVSILTVLVVAMCGVHSRAVESDSQSPVAVAEPAAGEYRFNYNVSEELSGDVKSHTESSDGTEITGTYRILQPDGCIRVVRYIAGTMGFQPTVTYEGDCQQNRSVDADVAQEKSAQEPEEETSVPQDLRSMAMHILDALLPVDEPMETTAIPADDPAEMTEAAADSITVYSASEDSAAPSAKTDSDEDDVDDVDGVDGVVDVAAEKPTARCWGKPAEETTPGVIIEKIPGFGEDDAIHTLPAYFQPRSEQPRPDPSRSKSGTVMMHPSPYLVRGSVTSRIPQTPIKNIRTYVIHTPQPSSYFNIFRKHPKLVPYKIKEVRNPQLGSRPPAGQLIQPVSVRIRR